MTKTGLLLACLVLALAASARADESIRFLGTVTVSPDGSTMAFSWRDDLWSVPLVGGAAKRLTFHPGRDRVPVFSPDGKRLAFTSNRTGSDQVYVMPASGGAPTRLTTDTGGSTAVDWYPGDRGLLIAATQDHFWRRAERLFFKKPELAAKPVLLFDDYARDAAVSPDGRHIAFTREGTSWWRKQYRGSQASQLWVYDSAGRAFRKLTTGNHEERWPLWTADGQSLVYVSQKDGTNNLYRRKLEGGDVEQLTRYVDDGVLFPAISRDGSVVVFRWKFEHYRLDLRKGGAPERIDVRFAGDPIHDPKKREMLTRASAAAFSEDGREIVFAAGGDLWVMDTELREPKRLTNTPEEERDPVFAPDYSAIYFVSDAGGQCDIWRATRKNARQAWWENDEFELAPITRDESVERYLEFVPGGRLAFVRERGDLLTMKLDGTDRKTAVASWNDPSFSFSPCGHWVAYARYDDDFNRDVWIGRADGSGKPVNVSRHPDTETNPVWSPDGKVLAFVGERNHEERDIHYVWLQKKGDEETSRDRKLDKARKKMKGRRPANAERRSRRKQPAKAPGGFEALLEALMPKAKAPKAAPKERKPTRIDFEGIEDRIRRVRIPNVSESGLMFSPDSKKLAFRASIDGRAGLYTLSIPDEMKPAFLAARPGSGGRWLNEGNQIVWLANGVPASTSARGKTTPYPFRVAHETDIGARNKAAFDVAWRVMRDHWYDDKHNNRDWSAVRAKYRDMAAHAHTDAELRQVVSMMLGELNGSHLGFWTSRRGGFTPPGWRHVTAHTGARFEDSFAGPGLRVRDVVKGTPAGQDRSRLNKGDVVLAVDGRVIEPGVDPAIYFTGEPGRTIVLKVRDASGAERNVSMRPVSSGVTRLRLYNHWIERNREVVDKTSNGTLGYLHVRGMNWPSFERFEAELYKVGHGKKGLIIDVRENGGGFTADHLLTCLCQPVHAVTVPRGGGRGYPQDRIVYARWSKPVVVLCNQNSFSNAEIFSHAIKQLGRGRVVGVTTAGGVISTGATRIMGFATLRLPFRGWFLKSTGEDMERAGCVPDLTIWPEPEEWTRGVDRQLAAGVNEALKSVAAEEAKPKTNLRKASER